MLFEITKVWLKSRLSRSFVIVLERVSFVGTALGEVEYVAYLVNRMTDERRSRTGLERGEVSVVESAARPRSNSRRIRVPEPSQGLAGRGARWKEGSEEIWAKRLEPL